MDSPGPNPVTCSSDCARAHILPTLQRHGQWPACCSNEPPASRPTASGPSRCPPMRLWGAQTARSLHFFAIGDAAHAAGGDPCAGLGEVGRGRGQRRARPAAGRPRPGHRRSGGAARGGRRVRRRVPAVGVADRLGHAEQHERQRSGRHLASRRSRRRAGARRGSPQRRREPGQSSNDVFPTAMHLAVALRARDPAAGAGRLARRTAARPNLRRGEGRPHPPAGRHAGDAGPGVRRLRRAARAVPSSALRQALGPCMRWPSAARRSAPA
jgi:hypothetical protein